MAIASSANAVRRSESDASTESVHVVTVCELAHWSQNRVGTRVRILAEYFTDLRHGAFLSDPRCPHDGLQIGRYATNADKESLAALDRAMVQHEGFYIGRKFKVDVTGIFEWDEGHIINKELPPDRQLRIPAHGVLALLKILSFEKPQR